MTDLIKQPTLKPTRKVAAGGVASVAFPAVAGLLASYIGGLMPEMSEACSNEVATGVLVWGSMQVQGLVSTVTSYMAKDRA